MPQMAPLNWLNLYFLFILLFILLMVVNYYTMMYTPKIKITKKMDKTLNWKW
uniref:ATP synthase complex subunit 8 n=1 Tax=Cionus olens TaxID=201874 RepID=J9PGR6_9CUCU|nr:ATP synthase F0 subunit 8 [Cionus olens]